MSGKLPGMATIDSVARWPGLVPECAKWLERGSSVCGRNSRQRGSEIGSEPHKSAPWLVQIPAFECTLTTIDWETPSAGFPTHTRPCFKVLAAAVETQIRQTKLNKADEIRNPSC